MGKRLDRLAHAWNAFTDSTTKNERSVTSPFPSSEVSYGSRPDRLRVRISNERSIIAAIYTRIAIDFSGVNMRHVRLDKDERFAETMVSGLNNCLRVEANIDQAGRMFRQDIVMSMFDKGTIAVVPIVTSINPEVSGGYDITDLRVGEIRLRVAVLGRILLTEEDRDGDRGEDADDQDDDQKLDEREAVLVVLETLALPPKRGVDCSNQFPILFIR